LGSNHVLASINEICGKTSYIGKGCNKRKNKDKTPTFNKLSYLYTKCPPNFIMINSAVIEILAFSRSERDDGC